VAQQAAAADPFSRKQLQEKAGAAAAAGVPGGQQPGRAPPEEGATVFIRSLPLDVTKEQVFTKMKVGWVGMLRWGCVECGRGRPRVPGHAVRLLRTLGCPLVLTAVKMPSLVGLWPRAFLPSGGGQGVGQAQGHRLC
jgi:hypothetical protein